MMKVSLGFWTCTLATILTIWAGAFVGIFSSALPEFADFLYAFGADVPRMTKAVLAHERSIRLLLSVLALAQLCSSIYFFLARTVVARRALYVSSAANIFAQLVLLAAVYVPVMRLGSVI